MAKMIITIKDFDIGVIDQPDDLEIEFRDYGIGEDDWCEDDPTCKTDKSGERYEEIMFSAKKDDSTTVKLAPQIEQIEFTVRSYYKHCNTEWDGDWNCACDDECPVCRKAISPYKHEDIT